MGIVATQKKKLENIFINISFQPFFSSIHIFAYHLRSLWNHYACIRRGFRDICHMIGVYEVLSRGSKFIPTFSFYEWLKNFQLMCNNKYGLFIGSIKQQHVNKKKLIDSKVVLNSIVLYCQPKRFKELFRNKWMLEIIINRRSKWKLNFQWWNVHHKWENCAIPSNGWCMVCVWWHYLSTGMSDVFTKLVYFN